jgi:hypothetical protein
VDKDSSFINMAWSLAAVSIVVICVSLNFFLTNSVGHYDAEEKCAAHG